MKTTIIVLALVLAAPLAGTARAQGTTADYERANGLKARYEHLVVNAPGSAIWIGKTHRFVYRLSVKDGATFMLYDADTRQKRAAFDHQKLAAALSAATKKSYTALTLPFNTFAFSDDAHSIDATFDGATWTCALADYSCKKADATPGGALAGARRAEDPKPRVSPDKKWEALIENFNIAIRPAGAQTSTPLSFDGSEGNPYQLSSIAWSPDSKKIAAYRVKPGYRREVHYVESSPEDQVQPKYSSLRYAKPGDVLDLEQPVLFDVGTKRQMVIDNALFPNPYSLSRLEWRKDSRAVTFEYNQRGHQVYRIIEVDAASGAARAVISEEPKTFFNYRTANGSQTDSGKKYRYDVADGKEVIWMSERDGWNHLYLFNGATGALENQITKGDWVVRGVVKVDEAAREVWFSACAQADLGFIVVQIDGMGTSNRSKAFQDVAWKNLGDAGLPDRVAWHKAVATKYPWYDINRVGVYGTSAGGQNSLGALLFEPDFYKAAVSAAGCHDNRMDKIWWNEQWMGWPLGPQYSASSNVDNAYRLQGHVLLVVGEMDSNVDPSSTMQVINQLIKHNKDFDFLYIPGAGHGAGGAYGEHKRFDFFVRHLLGVNPPEWTDLDRKASTQDLDEDQHEDFREDSSDLP